MRKGTTPEHRLIDELRLRQDVHDRQTSLLTDRDRRYLLDKHDTDSASYKRQMDQQIRQRITAGLLDISILANHYPDQQLSQIFDLKRGRLFDQDAFPDYFYFYHDNWGRGLQQRADALEQLEGERAVEGRPERRVAVTIFETLLQDMFTFAFRAALANDLPVNFETLVEAGLTRALTDYGKSATVDIDTFDLSRESLWEKLDTEQLNDEEVRILLDLETQSDFEG